jgi:hypothetical protein
MHSFWKIMPALVLGSAGIYAQTAMTQVAPPTAPTPIAAQTKPQMETPKTAMPCGVNEGNHCYARGCENIYGAVFEAEFLYWRAENSGFPYAYQYKSTFPAGGSDPYNIGSLMRLPAKWDPGFRIGVGWDTNFDRWDVFADWTWFKGHTSRSRSVDLVPDSVIGYFQMWPMSTGGSIWTHVDASWHLRHNVWDLELGRAYYITKAVSLRPFYGVRGGWIHQNFKSSLTVPTDTAAPPTYTQADFHGKNNYRGIGPRVGIQSKWHIDNSSWSVFGKASTALLLGETKTRYLTESLPTGTSVFITNQDKKDHFSQAVPTLQLYLGLDWGSCLDSNKYYLGINAGWEINYYWNQFNILTVMNPFGSPVPAFGNHAISMEGLTVNLHLDF